MSFFSDAWVSARDAVVKEIMPKGLPSLDPASIGASVGGAAAAGAIDLINTKLSPNSQSSGVPEPDRPASAPAVVAQQAVTFGIPVLIGIGLVAYLFLRGRK